jgi:hypothetical protein
VAEAPLPRMQVQAGGQSLEDLAAIIERHVRALRRDLAAHRRAAPWSWTDGDGIVIRAEPCCDDDVNPGCVHIVIGDAEACLTPHAQSALIAELRRA